MSRSERRSLAYHQAIAARLAEDPTLLPAARRRVEGWHDVHPFYRDGWRRLLAGSLQEIQAELVAETEAATALRQVSPFAGALSARERWQIWRSVA